MTTCFRVNSPNVIHETIEGEVILIDLKTGTYYSLREAGAAIWEAIDRGAGLDEIEGALELRYEGSPDEIRDSVRELVGELEREGLIRAEQSNDGDRAAGRPALELHGARRPFEAPSLEKHTDMQDLILLDPVHEVGAQGWPHPAPPDEADG
jgi:Coenzyme PQQ synthesis protein D (PqqD)